MNSSWRTRSSSERNAVPVEMRFIDMFMAALGSLVFMAMLLAFLLKFIPKVPPTQITPTSTPTILPISNSESGQIATTPTPSPTATEAPPLQLISKNIPRATVGETYEVAFAYRGGIGRISWEIAAGEKEIPAGLQFDKGTGVLKGAPTTSGTARFIVRAYDSTGGTAQKPYELMIVSAQQSTRRYETWVAIALIILTLLITLIAFGLATQMHQRAMQLEIAWNAGNPYMILQTGPNTTERIDLPEGITTYKANAKSIQGFANFCLLALIAEIAFFVWRFWFA